MGHGGDLSLRENRGMARVVDHLQRLCLRAGQEDETEARDPNQ